MLKTEDSIWYKKYAIELREKQFFEAKNKKIQDRNTFLELELENYTRDRRSSTNLMNKQLFKDVADDIDEQFKIIGGKSKPENGKARRSTVSKLKSTKICKKCLKRIDPVYNQLVVEEKVNQEMK